MLRSNYASRTEPATEPVTPSEVAEYLRIDYDDHDSMLANYAKESRRALEDGMLWKVCISQTCVDKFDGFDDDLELHYQPVSAISSITYTDTDGATQTLASTVYELGQRNGIGYVRLKYGQVWPATRSYQDVVTVTYTAGYGTTSASVPEPIRQAIIMYAGHLYDNPTDPPPSWVRDRVGPYADARAIA